MKRRHFLSSLFAGVAGLIGVQSVSSSFSPKRQIQYILPQLHKIVDAWNKDLPQERINYISMGAKAYAQFEAELKAVPSSFYLQSYLRFRGIPVGKTENISDDGICLVGETYFNVYNSQRTLTIHTPKIAGSSRRIPYSNGYYRYDDLHHLYDI